MAAFSANRLVCVDADAQLTQLLNLANPNLCVVSISSSDFELITDGATLGRHLG